MKSLVLQALKTSLMLVDRPPLEPARGCVVVQLKAAALNRRDYWITQGMYPGVKLPVVLGSDGAGVVSRCGPEVDASLLGRQCVINPGWNWGDDLRFQDPGFRILGMPNDGTFSEEVMAPVEYIHPKPAHLDWVQSAALPLAGLTAYRAVFTQGKLQPGESVLISGIGGGVATFALQFALAGGGRAVVTSSSPAKIAQALALGAKAGYAYTAEKWSKQVQAEQGQFDLIIDSAGGTGYAALLSLAAPGGRIVNYGSTAGPPPQLDLFKVFWKQLHLIGSTMGSPHDFQEMLTLVQQNHISPCVDSVSPLADGNEALVKMRKSTQFGKLVLHISD